MAEKKRVKRIDERRGTVRKWSLYWWFRRFSEVLLAVFCGWFLAAMIWEEDEMTGPLLAGISLASVVVYAFLQRGVLFGDEIDELEEE